MANTFRECWQNSQGFQVDRKRDQVAPPRWAALDSESLPWAGRSRAPRRRTGKTWRIGGGTDPAEFSPSVGAFDPRPEAGEPRPRSFGAGCGWDLEGLL